MKKCCCTLVPSHLLLLHFSSIFYTTFHLLLPLPSSPLFQHQECAKNECIFALLKVGSAKLIYVRLVSYFFPQLPCYYCGRPRKRCLFSLLDRHWWMRWGDEADGSGELWGPLTGHCWWWKANWKRPLMSECTWRTPAQLMMIRFS